MRSIKINYSYKELFIPQTTCWHVYKLFLRIKRRLQTKIQTALQSMDTPYYDQFLRRSGELPDLRRANVPDHLVLP